MRDKNWLLTRLIKAFKIIGWVAAAVGAVFFFIILIGGGSPQAPRITALLALAVGGFYWLFFFTVSEVLRLLVDIETNTRRS